jgi:hypothetical protein
MKVLSFYEGGMLDSEISEENKQNGEGKFIIFIL